MTLAVVFGLLTLFFTVLFILYINLLIFFFKERRKFFKEKGEKEYLESLEKRQKVKKNPQKKNFLLYLICLTCIEQGHDKKAKRLLSFVRTDLLLGIYPKKINL